MKDLHFSNVLTDNAFNGSGYGEDINHYSSKVNYESFNHPLLRSNIIFDRTHYPYIVMGGEVSNHEFLVPQRYPFFEFGMTKEIIKEIFNRSPVLLRVLISRFEFFVGKGIIIDVFSNEIVFVATCKKDNVNDLKDVHFYISKPLMNRKGASLIKSIIKDACKDHPGEIHFVMDVMEHFGRKLKFPENIVSWVQREKFCTDLARLCIKQEKESMGISLDISKVQEEVARIAESEPASAPGSGTAFSVTVAIDVPGVITANSLGQPDVSVENTTVTDMSEEVLRVQQQALEIERLINGEASGDVHRQPDPSDDSGDLGLVDYRELARFLDENRENIALVLNIPIQETPRLDAEAIGVARGIIESIDFNRQMFEDNYSYDLDMEREMFFSGRDF